MIKKYLSKRPAKMSLLLVAAVFLATGCSLGGGKVLSVDEIKAKSEKFINEQLLQGDSKAEVKEVTKENGMYKVVVEITGGQKVDSYMSLDGTKFFPQAYDIETVASENSQQAEQQDAQQKQVKENIPKNDKPSVELFVMSHCPYGTQIEKGIIPAIEALGNKVDFKLKFCDYAMHGEKEVKEQLQQVCIDKEQNDKLFSYLKCFLKDGNSENCLKEAKVDTKKLEACIKKIDSQYEVTKKLNDKSSWISGSFPPFEVYAADNEKYGVKGSPALVINGTTAESSRDAASLLGTICAGFSNKPEECSKQLSSAPPSPGFGEGTGTTSGGDCGS